jgi:NAD(P)H dehydrogenase (quinone)
MLLKGVYMEARIVVAFHSGYGHTARQGEAVAEGVAEVAHTQVDIIRLGTDLTQEQWDLLQQADAVIFGSPTYMSGASAGFRSFTEATSKVWNDDLRWRNKIAAGFTNSGNHSGDKLQTLVEIALFAAQHGMIWVGMAHYGGWNTSTGSHEDLNRLGSWLGAMAQSDMDQGPEIAPPAADLRTAAALGRRVAEITHQYIRGRAGVNGDAEVDRDGALIDA